MMRTILIGDTETCISELQEVYTHGGKFHADDVCTVALLRFFGFNGKVNRVFKISDELKESGALIFDIGGGEFDHHSKDNLETYEDGCPMAAFGKVARNIRVDGVELENLFPGFTEEIAKPIEAHDNGYSSDDICQSYFAKICNAFVPAWNEETDMDFAFERAVDLCYEVLRRQLIHLSSKQVAAIEIQKAKVIDNVIILEKFVPWQDHIDDNIKAAIFPSLRGGYNLQIAPDKNAPAGTLAIKARLNFTEEQEALCTFIHPTGFICATNTLADAIKLIPGVELRN